MPIFICIVCFTYFDCLIISRDNIEVQKDGFQDDESLAVSKGQGLAVITFINTRLFGFAKMCRDMSKEVPRFK